MIDISQITMKELTEYADYCMGMIPIEERTGFPGEMRGITNVVRCEPFRSVESAIIDGGPDDQSIIIDIYGPGHRQVMAARVWLNNGRIYLIKWDDSDLLYDRSPDRVDTFEEFKVRRALPVVPKGILKIPARL